MENGVQPAGPVHGPRRALCDSCTTNGRLEILSCALAVFWHHVVDLWRRTLRHRSHKDHHLGTDDAAGGGRGSRNRSSFILGRAVASPSHPKLARNLVRRQVAVIAAVGTFVPGLEGSNGRTRWRGRGAGRSPRGRLSVVATDIGGGCWKLSSMAARRIRASVVATGREARAALCCGNSAIAVMFRTA